MKISVIMPVYNGEKYIQQTLDVLRLQSFPNKDYEVIVFLDGCTDSSPELVGLYKRNHPEMNLRIIKCEANQGISNARNACIAAAKGEYLHFMDSDDMLNTNFYSEMYEAAIRTDSEVVVSCFYNEKFPEHSLMFDAEIIISNGQDKINHTLVDHEGYSTRYLIRKSYWEAQHFSYPTDMRYVEDMLLMNKVVYFANHICLVPGALYIYKQRTGSILNGRANKEELKLCHHRAKVDTFVFLTQYELQRSVSKFPKRCVRLFGFIPFVTVVDYIFLVNVYLFGFIKIFSVRRKTKNKVWKIN